MRKLFTTFALLAIIGLSASAQWQQTPYYNRILCLTTDGTNIFAGGDGNGIHLSTDNGASWNDINNGLTNTTVWSLAISGSNIFAGTDSGLFISTNNGGLWTAANNGLTNTHIWSLAINGTNIFAGTYSGLFLSTNNGGLWTPINNGLTDTIIRTILINDTNIFVGTDEEGIFLSTNNGGLWTPVSNGLTTTNILALLVNDSNIFAGTNYSGVFLSTDNGDIWTAQNNGLTVNHILAFTKDGDKVFTGTANGGVFLSTNNGELWIDVNDGLQTDNYYIYSFAIVGTDIYIGTSHGVWKRPLSEMSGIIEIIETGNISSYPNPANDRITVRTTSLDKNAKIFICNIQGQILIQQQIQQTKTAIDISGLAKGVYMLKLTNSGKTEIKRFIKE